MCPHGVRVALVGGEKQMGHVYVERGSGTGLVDVVPEGAARMGDVDSTMGEGVRASFEDPTTRSSESESSMVTAEGVARGWSTGGGVRGAIDDCTGSASATSEGISHVESWVWIVLGWVSDGGGSWVCDWGSSTSLPESSNRLRF